MPSHPRIDPRILGYLGRALSLELSAVQQYMAHASLADSWGMADVSKALRQEVVEESRHAERIVDQMTALGVAPNASQLRPVSAGTALHELLLHDHKMEQDIITLYQDAVAYCSRVGTSELHEFFAKLLDEELHHAQELAAWLRRLNSSAPAAR
ncbi:MAG: hypothetical protein AMJ69_07970 [Gammaproteobacteria bacterium SG8_47]|nr:MAG: hypothetical protein AMJ69_07970 [Gammaproteobacteria bacterium SG8_47]